MLHTLPRVSRPTGALAVLNQGHTVRVTPPPRNMTLNTVYVDKRRQKVPKGSAVNYMNVLMRGYLSTRTLMAAERATEVMMLFAAENCELKHAAQGTVAADNSLPPRAVAVTLLVHGADVSQCNGARVFVDALGYLANRPLASGSGDTRRGAEVIRLTVLAGVDAAWFAGSVEREAVDTAPSFENGSVDVCVRWCNEGALRSEFCKMPSGRNLDQSLEAAQNCFLSMKISYGVPFPPTISAVHVNVPNDAWVRSVHDASEEFFNEMEGPPGVFKGAVFQKHQRQLSIESTGVFVRICPRLVHDPQTGQWVPIDLAQAVARHDAFHAFLVGNGNHLREIAAFCKQHEREGLPPVDDETQQFCLHTCGVQANSHCLNEKISLYAVHHAGGGRTPGVPITSPGSWVWRTEAAVVAIEHVLPKFYLLPCSRDSVMPGDRKLEPAFNEFFNRAYQLYYHTFGKTAKPSAGDELECLPVPLHASSSGCDLQVLAAEEYALTAFNLDASSKRITTGDALVSLQSARAPPPLATFMLQSSLRFGINTSVIDALSCAAAALERDHERSTMYAAGQKEAARCKRIADAAISVSSKRRQTVAQSVEIEASRVRSLLATAGLKGGQNTWVKSADSGADFSPMVEVLASMLLKNGCSGATHEHACEQAYLAMAAAKQIGDGEPALAAMAAASTILRGASDAAETAVFVVLQRDENEKSVSFNQLLAGGLFEKTTPGKMIDAPLALVLLLKLTARGLRLTTTQRH